jgi:hypothetical protein
MSSTETPECIQFTAAKAARAAFISAQQTCKLNSGINELTDSPYQISGMTQAKLQMRRKAEILQYRGPGRAGDVRAASSRAVRGSRAMQYIDYVNACTVPITNIETLSSGSDVPGQIIKIKYDPSVVLYNYKQTTGVIVPARINSSVLDLCYTTSAII